jgi:hypothetical protein
MSSIALLIYYNYTSQQGFGDKRKLNIEINFDMMIPNLATAIFHHFTALCVKYEPKQYFLFSFIYFFRS